MTNADLIKKTEEFVKRTLANAEGGHDWFHVERVRNSALHIAKIENADVLIVELAALLHDIADSKFHDGNEELGPKMAADFLKFQNVASADIAEIVRIIESVSFKGGHNIPVTNSLEFKVVLDADRLDALGAIGIARTFNYGGFKNRAIYDPSIPPNLNMSREEYKKSDAPTINHFYEKLLLLKDLMQTETGKKMAAERHAYMEGFLKQFYAEFKGEI